MLNAGVELIGHDAASRGAGVVTGAAVCDRSVTMIDDAFGANITAMWQKHYAPADGSRFGARRGGTPSRPGR